MIRRLLLTTSCVILSVPAFLRPSEVNATPPFGNTFLVKKDGKWHCPSMFTRDLIIVDKDSDTSHRLPLTELFPGGEYKLNVSETTAGPWWGLDALHFVAKFRGVDYFYMRCPSGKQILINLDTGKLQPCEAHAVEIAREEKVRVLSTLSDTAAALCRTEKAISSSDKLHGAILLAIRMNLREAREQLEVIEKEGTCGALIGVHGDYGYGKGLSQALRGNPFMIFPSRCIAQLALRRLGFDALGYPVHVFDVGRQRGVLNPQERRNRVVQVRKGDSSQRVYELLGGPDYIKTAVEDNPNVAYAYRKKKWIDGWRYDFGGKDDFSAIILWDDDGNVKRIEKITPGLWRGDELFSDGAAKPVFSIDGSLNGIYLYSDHFQGKVTPLVPNDDEREKEKGQ